jgi:hypothetical protein
MRNLMTEASAKRPVHDLHEGKATVSISGSLTARTSASRKCRHRQYCGLAQRPGVKGIR